MLLIGHGPCVLKRFNYLNKIILTQRRDDATKSHKLSIQSVPPVFDVTKIPVFGFNVASLRRRAVKQLGFNGEAEDRVQGEAGSLFQG